MSDELKEKLENNDINDDEAINILDIADDEAPAAEEAVEEVTEEAPAVEDIAEPEETEEVIDIDSENPLVVHKQGDTSFFSELNKETEKEDEDEDDGEATLRRHRFRKEKKSGGKRVLILAVLFCLIAIGAALYFTGNLSFSPQNTTTQKAEVNPDDKETTTSLQDKYKGTIVVKGTYIFVDGEEVDGIEGLQSALEYEDKSTTAYVIIDEDANADFFNYDVLDILTQLGFYGKDTKTEHVANTGLVAGAETTTLPPETTTKATTAKATTTKKAAATTTKKAE